MGSTKNTFFVDPQSLFVKVKTHNGVSIIAYHFAKQNIFPIKSNRHATHNCLQDHGRQSCHN